MKINEILVESQLQEGPILNKIGSAIGKGAGTLAKGVGAVAGGIAGLGGAIKKGFQAGKATVGAAGDDEAPSTGAPAAGGGAPVAKTAATAATSAPAAKTTAAAAAPASSGTPATGEAPGAAPAEAPAKAAPAAGKVAPAAGKVAPNPKADTAYAQAQKAIAGLQPEQKKEIVTMLQADPKVKAAMTAKPKTKPAAPADAGAGAMGAMAGQLAKGGAAEPNTMANAPVSKTNKAKPGNPNAAPAATEPAAPAATEPAAPKRTGGKVAGQLSQTPGAIRKREATARKGKQKPAAPDQATIDAERERIMGPTSDSIIRTKPMMSESFSLFRKR